MFPERTRKAWCRLLPDPSNVIMIHPTAIVSPGASVGTGVEIAPFAVIDDGVVLEDGVKIGPHVHVLGHTRIGAGTRIHAGAVIGDEPQDLHYDGSPNETIIGRECVLREYVTIHRGAKAGTRTVVGDRVMLMAFSHLGHNCVLGNDVVVANATLLAGHVEVGDRAFISGGGLIHQFCRIGTLAMVGGGARLGQDIPPFCLYQWGGVCSHNAVGMRRSGYDVAARTALKGAIRLFFFTGLIRSQAVARIRDAYPDIPAVAQFIQFVESSRRGIAPARPEHKASEEEHAEAE